MQIDEAIKHCLEVAEQNQIIVDNSDYYGKRVEKCEKCAKEHRQLAEWLTDYKRLKEAWGKVKAEILKAQTYVMFEGDTDLYVERKDVLEIIDRYTEEL